MGDIRRFLSELRRRRVYRVGVVYAVVAFVALQVADLVWEPLQLPPWTMGLITVLAAVGFPLALVLAWAFEVTPDGMRRTLPEAGEAGSPPDGGGGRWHWVALMTLGVLAAGGLWAGVRFGPGSQAPEVASFPTTIAVLPVTDMSPEGDHGYFADGMTEELIFLLGGVEGLRAVPRTSVFQFKGQAGDVRDMGATLGADAVLEGSVRRFQDRMRITVQLVDVSTGFPLWSDSFDRGVEDILQVQDDIARSIVEALRGRLLPASAQAVRGRSEVEFHGYDLYLRGRYLWHRRTGPALRDALRLFEEAVAISPGFARGHVGVGDAYAILGFYEFLAPEEAFPQARAAARRALELDPTLAPAHATLGYVALYYEWDWDRAEAEFRRAIELDPGYSTAHQWYGNHLTAMGRFAEAEAAMRRAMELDPLSLIANAALGWVYYYGGEPTRAIEQLRRTHELDPEFDLARLWEGQALEELGRYDEAVAAIEEAAEIDGGSDVVMAALARAQALRGRPDLAMEVLEGFAGRGDESWLPAYDIARVHEALGDHEAAFLWLRRALDGRSHSMVFLQVDPAFSGLRSDPRFDELVRTVGLPPTP